MAAVGIADPNSLASWVLLLFFFSRTCPGRNKTCLQPINMSHVLSKGRKGFLLQLSTVTAVVRPPVLPKPNVSELLLDIFTVV